MTHYKSPNDALEAAVQYIETEYNGDMLPHECAQILRDLKQPEPTRAELLQQLADDAQDIKSCAFCGSNNIGFGEGDTYRWLMIGCEECGIKMEVSKKDRAKNCDDPVNQKDAIAAWNRRIPAPVESAKHESDCAVHNAPALPIGACDCESAKHEATKHTEPVAWMTDFENGIQEGVRRSFDFLQHVAANTDDPIKDQLLVDLSEDLLEFAPEFNTKWLEMKAYQKRVNEIKFQALHAAGFESITDLIAAYEAAQALNDSLLEIAGVEKELNEFGQRIEAQLGYQIVETAAYEAAKQDAARYRWLRDIGDKTWVALTVRSSVTKQVIDEVIDAAIAAAPSPEGKD